MTLQKFVVSRGKLATVGRQPDGDSIRFIPENPQTLMKLPRASRLRYSRDGSVQLRLDGIDAPETHFLSYMQPLGDVARDALLEEAGFDEALFDAAGTITATKPAIIPVTILVGMLDPYGRPVSFLLAGHPKYLRDGAMIEIDESHVSESINARMLQDGAAYLTLYGSTPPALRQILWDLADTARGAERGVWVQDKTSKFRLNDYASIGPDGGQLILPKLFRRAIAYLRAVDKGYEGQFPEWIQGTANDPFHSSDDMVIRQDGTIKPLHSLVHESKDHVVTTDIDPLTDIFIEQ